MEPAITAETLRAKSAATTARIEQATAGLERGSLKWFLAKMDVVADTTGKRSFVWEYNIDGSVIDELKKLRCEVYCYSQSHYTMCEGFSYSHTYTISW